MEQILIKRSKWIKGTGSGTLAQPDGCMCFTGWILFNRGFSLQELLAYRTPFRLATSKGKRGMKGLIGPNGCHTDTCQTMLTVNDDPRFTLQEREIRLKAEAQKIGVEPIFHD